MKCSICGAEVDAGYNSCPYCGNKIEWPELKREQTEELRDVPYNDEFRFCIRCGRRLDPETHVCPSCGYRYAAAQDQSAGASAQTKSAGYPSDTVRDDGYGAYSRGDSSSRTGPRIGAEPVRAVGKAAGKVVRGAASAIPSGGGGMSGKNKKNKKKNKKKNTGKIVVLSVIGMMALFAVTFVIFFNLLGGSFSSDEPTASPSVSPSSSPAAAEWTPSISTRAPATQRPQSAGTRRTPEPEPTRRPARTPEPAPTQAPEEEISEPETGTGDEEQEQPAQEEQTSENENVLDVE